MTSEADVLNSESPRERGVALQAGSAGSQAEVRTRRSHGGAGILVSRYAMLGLMILMIVGFSIVCRGTFPTFTNLKVVLTTQAVTAVLAIAMVFPLVVGAFDLSIGAVCGLCSVLTAGLTAQWLHLPVAAAAFIAVMIGLFIGLINGLLVTKIGINALISTLGMATLLGGLVLSWTKGASIAYNIPASLLTIARTQLLGIPLPAFYMAGIGLISWYLLEKTPFGRYLYAIGGSKEAARLAGVNVRRLTLVCFVIAGALAGLGGVMTASRTGVGDPSVGPNFILPVFASALLGAAAVKPGVFNVAGTFVGVFTLAVGVNGLQLLGVPFWIEPIFNGLALIIAVALTRYLQREEL
jgi:ribose transport system permease protein